MVTDAGGGQAAHARDLTGGHSVAADRTTWLVNFQTRDGADPVAAEYDVIADGKGARAHPYRANPLAGRGALDLEQLPGRGRGRVRRFDGE